MNQLPEIRLTPWEIQVGGFVAVQRMTEVIVEKRKHTFGSKTESNWQRHCEGALAEQALAKFLNLYWQGKGNIKDPDVGGLFDARFAMQENYSLILHRPEDDPPDRVFYLLTGGDGIYTVRGWMRARDGQQEQFWKDPTGHDRPAYFVPQRLLNSPYELPPEFDFDLWDSQESKFYRTR